MSEKIMVSVIMLTYNQERYIARALESVLGQETEFSYEILVGDDCSGDRTREIILQYQERFPDQIRFFQRPENIGAARNAYDLITHSRGEYLAFCEGDDYWTDPKKLAKQVTFLENNPAYIGCTHRCELVDEAGNPLPRQRLSWVKYRKTFSFRDFEGGKYLPGQTATVVKRNIFRDSHEDWSILYTYNEQISDRMATAIYLVRGDFACLEECMSAYRQGSIADGKNLTAKMFKNNPQKCLDELTMTRGLESYCTAALGKEVRFSRKRSDILLDAIWECCRQNGDTQRKAA